MKTNLTLLAAFLVTHFSTAAWAAEVVIPDAALKAAIWRALGKPLPEGILTEQDMSSLTNLDASNTGVQSLDGLEAARNLITLVLSFNHLTSLALPDGLTSLTTLDLTYNQLESLTLPAGLTNLTTLSVSIYLPTLRRVALPRTMGEAFDLLLTGPPGTYSLQVTQDFSTWTDLDPVTLDANGSIGITDPSANTRPHSFYRAVRSN